MAGKKKIDGARSHRPGWGGARPGSGRRRITELSDAQVSALFRAVKKRAKVEHRHWHDVLLDYVYGVTRSPGGEATELDITPRDRLAAVKLLADMLIGKREEKRPVQDKTGPAITLPPVREDPGKIIPLSVGGGE